jgi:rSAM/selenodomain-associated transferase 2
MNVNHLTVSIIIPTLNEAENIGSAITRAWQTGPREVIVVDGGSSDATCTIAAAHQCLLLQGPRGRGVQQNLAARHARGEVLLFLHADTWLEPGALEQVTSALDDRRVLAGAFCQQIDAPGRRYRLLERGNALRAGRWGRPFGDQGIFVRREMFERVGGFPEVALLEDVLLMRRVRRYGWPVLLPGPIHVSPRRWQREGVVRQTLRNWLLLTAATLGVSPARLAAFYSTHN